MCYAHWLAAKGLSASSIQTRLSQILTLPTTFGVGLTSESDRVRSMRIILSLVVRVHWSGLIRSEGVLIGYIRRRRRRRSAHWI